MKVWKREDKLWYSGLRMRSISFLLAWGCKPVRSFAFQVQTNENHNANLEPKRLHFIKTILCVRVLHWNLDKIHMKPCPAWAECEPQWLCSKSSSRCRVLGDKPTHSCNTNRKRSSWCAWQLLHAFHWAQSGEEKETVCIWGMFLQVPVYRMFSKTPLLLAWVFIWEIILFGFILFAYFPLTTYV